MGQHSDGCLPGRTLTFTCRLRADLSDCDLRLGHGGAYQQWVDVTCSQLCGFQDTLVSLASHEDKMLELLIYGAGVLVCVVGMRVYQCFDHRYDPMRDLNSV